MLGLFQHIYICIIEIVIAICKSISFFCYVLETKCNIALTKIKKVLLKPEI